MVLARRDSGTHSHPDAEADYAIGGAEALSLAGKN